MFSCFCSSFVILLSASCEYSCYSTTRSSVADQHCSRISFTDNDCYVTCAVLLQCVPDITVEVVIATHHQTTALWERHRSNATDDVVVWVHADLLVRTDVKQTTCGVVRTSSKCKAAREKLKRHNRNNVSLLHNMNFVHSHDYSATTAASVELLSQTEPVYSLAAAQAHGHGLWPVAIQPCVHLNNPCKYIDYYSHTNPGEMEGWAGFLIQLLFSNDKIAR